MTASPTPPDAQVGLPSEEDLARSIYHSKPRNKPWDVLTHEFKNQYRKQARAILDLIRLAFEAKERMLETSREAGFAMYSKHAEAEARALSAEAKLAQAVEAPHPNALVKALPVEGTASPSVIRAQAERYKA